MSPPPMPPAPIPRDVDSLARRDEARAAQDVARDDRETKGQRRRRGQECSAVSRPTG